MDRIKKQFTFMVEHYQPPGPNRQKFLDDLIAQLRTSFVEEFGSMDEEKLNELVEHSVRGMRYVSENAELLYQREKEFQQKVEKYIVNGKFDLDKFLQDTHGSDTIEEGYIHGECLIRFMIGKKDVSQLFDESQIASQIVGCSED